MGLKTYLEGRFPDAKVEIRVQVGQHQAVALIRQDGLWSEARFPKVWLRKVNESKWDGLANGLEAELIAIAGGE